MDTIYIKDNSSRKASNIQQGRQQELTTTVNRLVNSRVGSRRENRNITDVNSRRETCNGKDASNSGVFRGNSRKTCQKGDKFVKKDPKRVKVIQF